MNGKSENDKYGENGGLCDDEQARKLLCDAADRLKITLSERETSKFLAYKDLLVLWNKKINLTNITDAKQIMLKHFADSLSALPFIGKNDKVIDVGTGGGFPGVPLKIVSPAIELTLMDSLNKRVNFLRELSDKLELAGVSLICGRAEAVGRDEGRRESYDVSISRAVAPLNVLAEYCLPFVKPGGAFLAMKGANAGNEAKDAKRAIELLGGEITEINSFSICAEGMESAFRTIIIISKIKNTPAAYPRREGIPSKRPL